jgi:hypothetical protein
VTANPETPGSSPKSRYAPYVFTEQGVAMLSSVLRSERAVTVNIQIMRTFVAMRRYTLPEELVQYIEKDSEDTQAIMHALDRLLATIPPPRRQLGFGVTG